MFAFVEPIVVSKKMMVLKEKIKGIKWEISMQQFQE
jgi:hypothetical protein